MRVHNVCQPVRIPSYHSEEENKWLYIIRTPDAKLETGEMLMWRKTCRSVAAGYSSNVDSSALDARWISALTSLEELC